MMSTPYSRSHRRSIFCTGILLCTLSAAPALAAPLHDGLHDFDAGIGVWKEHTRRLKNPLTGSTTWIELDGISVAHKLLGGRGNLIEYEGDGPDGHLSLISIRLYDPATKQWYVNFATPGRGTLSPTPLVGHFENGRGDFYSNDDLDGRAILTRFSFLSESPTTARTEQAFSADGGKTWEVNWINDYTRLPDSEATRALFAKAAPPPGPDSDGRHDFDYAFGTWKTHISRLKTPLSGGGAWTDYDGTTTVHRIWNGRANLVELEVSGPAGRIDGIGLRLFNPRSRQWTLHWASAAVPTMSPPWLVGSFQNGRGEFFDQEPFNDKMILVRNLWTEATTREGKFEQAFSADGGKTWETNWRATDTRIKPAPEIGW